MISSIKATNQLSLILEPFFFVFRKLVSFSLPLRLHQTMYKLYFIPPLWLLSVSAALYQYFAPLRDRNEALSLVWLVDFISPIFLSFHQSTNFLEYKPKSQTLHPFSQFLHICQRSKYLSKL